MTSIILALLLLSISQPDCWGTYWECTQPAENAFKVCVSPCHADRDEAIEPCKIVRENCSNLRKWKLYLRCFTGPEPAMFYYFHYETRLDEEHQIEWLEPVIVPVGQPYECRIQCDSDRDGDVDLFDVAQAFAYSPTRNCVARGKGTREQCEERFRK